MKKLFFRSALQTEEPMKLSGYAYRFGDKGFADGTTEEIQKGAFKDLENKKVFMYMNHDPKKVLGKSGENMKLYEDEEGLKFEIELPETSDAKDAYELVKKNIMDGVSVGMNARGTVIEYSGDHRIIKEADLEEISLTQKPVYEQTSVEAREKKESLPPPILW